MKSLTIDIETYSDTDIGKCGVYRYADDHSFAILLFAYSVDGAAVNVVDLASGEQIPDELLKALSDPRVIKHAYNASFERVCLSKYLGMPTGTYLAPEGWHCDMVHAATLGLPLSLAQAGKALNLPEDKLKMREGKKLIKIFCCPGNDGKRHYVTNAFDKADWEVFKAYNMRDVETEMEISKRLDAFPVSDAIWEEYCFDQRINDRGVLVDKELAEGAMQIYNEVVNDFVGKMRDLTGLANPASTAQLLPWLQARGYAHESLGKNEIADELARNDLDPTLREVLTLRQRSAKTSVMKYDTMLRSMCSDGRCRGMFQFYGAIRTGRWAGRLVQLQNLPQNHLDDLAKVREIVKRHDTQSLEMLYDSPLDVLSQLIRTAFIAAPGKRFVVADFSAIEARVVAWLAGEEWRLKVFQDGGDIYCKSATQMFHVPVVKHGINGQLRQKGKVAELACGYGGAVGALKAMGASRMGLTDREMQEIVSKWRQASPHIVKFWWDVDTAVRNAINGEGIQRVGAIKFGRRNDWLFIKLPSGRRLAYFKPECTPEGKITYMGSAVGTAGYFRVESYGPKFVENIVQATSRDLLCNAMRNVGSAHIEMHIHDELVIEAPKEITLKETIKQMTTNPGWAKDLPLNADGYETPFYKKD